MNEPKQVEINFYGTGGAVILYATDPASRELLGYQISKNQKGIMRFARRLVKEAAKMPDYQGDPEESRKAIDQFLSSIFTYGIRTAETQKKARAAMLGKQVAQDIIKEQKRGTSRKS